MLEGSALSAVLGPTNTGKTHRAVERMLSYDTGMIGLPLRLLAREVYDRITAQIGEARVALVTGEEKRVPRSPSYWVCTVEAMPTDREVDFVAIDEIQLAASEQRGHVFTERLLNARGRRETWLLGAETMRDALAELVPAARVVTHPRLSRLTFRGMERLGKIPPRSAIIGFSAAQVFELGEKLRASRGGAAVVMGALSPRTRNAQVAMFQSGEVDYLVATDAIGMGLNMHVGHVAFAALRKFDGARVRELDTSELAQIAGRAGRYRNDGTFGTLDPLFLPEDVAHAIESHRFPRITRLSWRSGELDFSTLENLLQSLRERPRSRWLRLVEDAEDTAALSMLMHDPEVRARARGEEAIRLLWDVCRIPDFRKLTPESHAALLRDVYLELGSPAGRLSDDWMERRVRVIDDVAGEVETLTDRLARIRTMTFLASHAAWVAHAEAWQDRTRQVEDRLSDALHDRLVARFVEKGSKHRRSSGKPRNSSPRAPEDAVTVDASHPFARLLSLRKNVAPGPVAPPAPGEDAWVSGLVAAPHAELTLDRTGEVRWRDRRVGRLHRGPRLLLPEVRLLDLGDLGAGARSQVVRRLTAFARDAVDELLGPLRSARVSTLSPAARGIVYQLEQGLGTALASEASVQLATLDEEGRGVLAELGILLGAHVLSMPRLLASSSLDRRLALVRTFFEHSPRPPARGAVSLPLDARVLPAAYVALGYPPAGPRAVRADVLERVVGVLRKSPDAPDLRVVAHWLGCSPKAAETVVSALSPSVPGVDAAS